VSDVADMNCGGAHRCGCQAVIGGAIYICELPPGHQGDHQEGDYGAEDEAFVTMSWPRKLCVGCRKRDELLRALAARRAEAR
jgi:hypothetical protein